MKCGNLKSDSGVLRKSAFSWTLVNPNFLGMRAPNPSFGPGWATPLPGGLRTPFSGKWPKTRKSRKSRKCLFWLFSGVSGGNRGSGRFGRFRSFEVSTTFRRFGGFWRKLRFRVAKCAKRVFSFFTKFRSFAKSAKSVFPDRVRKGSKKIEIPKKEGVAGKVVYIYYIAGGRKKHFFWLFSKKSKKSLFLRFATFFQKVTFWVFFERNDFFFFLKKIKSSVRGDPSEKFFWSRSRKKSETCSGLTKNTAKSVGSDFKIFFGVRTPFSGNWIFLNF